jgi:hypothetical protein
MFAMLESLDSVAPMDAPPGADYGTGVGPREIKKAPVADVGDVGDLGEERAEKAGPKKVAALPREYAQPTILPGPRGPAQARLAAPVGPAAKPQSGLSALQDQMKAVLARDATQVHPPLYIPSNRRAFKQFIIQTYRRYYLPKPSDIPDPDACAKAAEESKKGVKTFAYQSFVRDFIQRPSPYRGVLVFHGLGSGKTCTSIASMEALYNRGQKPVYIFTPASLSKNYRDEITKCGPFIFRTNNNWQWIPVPSLKAPTPEAEYLMNVLGVPRAVIAKQGGGWSPNPAAAPNFETLTSSQQKQIVDQIYAHIDYRFQFIHYNGLLEKTVRRWACEDPTMFDGATIVIDEVHNLIRTINNSHMEEFYKDEPREMQQYTPKFCDLGKKYRISYLLYRILCSAVGCKIIALSGTPIINYPHEIAILANILAGDTRMAEATLPGFERKDQILKALERHPEVDFAEIVPRPDINASMVRITPGPSGCRKVLDPATGAFRGFVRDVGLAGTAGEIARERNLEGWFQRVVEGTGIKDPVFKSITRLPDLEKPFRELFVDSEKLEIKDRARLPLMARLSGLVSYYKGGKADLMAKVNFDKVVYLPMSDLQLKEYTAMRKEEIDKEQKEQKRKKPAAVAVAQGPTLYDLVTKGQKSTFKIFSRAACNFAFPTDMDRPRPSDYRDVQMALGVADEEKAPVPGAPGAVGNVGEAGEAEVAPELVEEMNEVLAPKKTDYGAAIAAAISELRARAGEIFSPENLPKYSPKFQTMLDNMDGAKGPVLVYSQFKTLEGVGLFSMALEAQKGYVKFDIVQGAGGSWTLTEETKASMATTPRYITYTGDEDAEKRNILKAVFNAAWSKMPQGLAEEIKALTGAENNQKGQIARVFMITQSGAEGISLSNVRQVHIMEPYWNYVRLEQVKGRAIRICSHMDLPPEERNVDVYTYICKFAPSQLSERLVDETLLNFDGGVTTDESILNLSNAKKKLSDSLFSVMQAAAVDCDLNAMENGVLACYTFSGAPTMEPLFHPLVNVHLAESEAAVRAR